MPVVSEVETSGLAAGGYSVTLPTFEGPLDLLLHLCQKHELDILDIPIGFVTEKYLEFISVMQLIDLDLASEYLVMAATLAHIKSKMLLPAPPPGQEEDGLTEEEIDPREALIRRLLEYQKYKKAGEDLAARGITGRDIFFRGMPVDEAVQTGLPPLKTLPLFSLVEAFQGVLSKSKIKISHDVVHERITLTDRINELVDILRVRKRLAFEELFTGLSTRFDLVITFLALLEMTKLRMTRLVQMDYTSPIYVEFSAQVTADEEADAVAGVTADTREPQAEDAPDAEAHADAAADADAEAHADAEAEAEADADADAEAHAEADADADADADAEPEADAEAEAEAKADLPAYAEAHAQTETTPEADVEPRAENPTEHEAEAAPAPPEDDDA